MVSPSREDEALLDEGARDGVPLAQIRRKAVGQSDVKTPSQSISALDEAPNASTTSEQPLSELPSAPKAVAQGFWSPFRWWCFEIISIIIAIACLASIVAILLIFDGKPQHAWPSEALTINGLIALLATACRTSFMVAVGAGLAQGKWHQLSSRGTHGGESFELGIFGMFEEASRGPWGSSRLIWRLKGLHVTCLGAAVSILSLAFSVFSQQLISFRTDAVATTSLGLAGQVPRGSRMGAMWDGEEEGSYDEEGMSVSPAMKMAVYNGFMSNSVDWPQVVCPSGNCTWPIIPTLGVCGACVNTTDTISVRRVSGSRCAATVSRNLTIERPCDPEDSSDGPVVRFLTGPGSGEIFNITKEIGVTNSSSNLLANFAGLRVGVQGPSVPVLNGSMATECALWYCMQAHNISTVGGKLKDEVIDTWHEAKSTIEPEEPNSYTVNSTLDFYMFGYPSTYNTYDDEIYHAVSWRHSRLRSYLADISDGRIRGAINAYEGEGRSNKTGGDYVTGFYKSFGELDKWIDRLAKSMTNAIRAEGRVGVRHPDPEEHWNNDDLYAAVRKEYEGTVYMNQVVIVVRWGWISYLVSLVALSVVFLVAQMVHTAKRIDIRAWKDDPLIPLWLNIDAALRNDFGRALENPKGTKEVVGDCSVLVTRQPEGFPDGFRLKQE